MIIFYHSGGPTPRKADYGKCRREMKELERLGIKERHHALGDEENTSADGAVTNYMNQAIEGQDSVEIYLT